MIFIKYKILFLVIVATFLGFLLKSQSFEDIQIALFDELDAATNLQDSIDLYNDIAYNYRRNTQKEIMEYADIAIRLGLPIQYKKGLAYGYRNKGIAYYKKGNARDSSLLAYETAIEYAIEAKEYYCQAACINNIGLLQLNEIKFNMAIQYFLEGLSLMNEKAIEGDFLKALMNGNIGTAYYRLKDNNKALEYYEKALGIAEKDNNKVIISIYLDQLALTYMEMGKEDIAETFIQKTLPLHSELGDYQSLVETQATYAKIKLNQGKAEEAVEYAKRAYDNAILHDIKIQRTKALSILAESYLAVGDMKNAEYYALQAKEENNLEEISLQRYKILTLLADIYGEKQNYELAYQYIQKANLVSAELNDIEKSQATRELEANFQNTEKEKQIQQFTSDAKERDIKIKFLTSFTLLTLSLLTVVAFLYRKKNRLADELEKKNEEITLQSEELVEINLLKDKLFSTISHDIRSPIASLENSLNFLLSGDLNPDEFMLYANDLKKNTHQLRNTTDELMKWAYMQITGLKAKLEELNLYSSADNSIKFHQAVIQEKELNIKNDLPSNLSITFDREYLSSIFRNLVSNAIKFSNQRGVITLNGENRSDHVLFWVKDEGVGIAQDKLKHIFDIGYTEWGTSGEKGTGLGLSICKEFVEKNKGTIWVSSEEGIGSTFYVSLPNVTNN